MSGPEKTGLKMMRDRGVAYRFAGKRTSAKTFLVGILFAFFLDKPAL